jgi:hypothetical protein
MFPIQMRNATTIHKTQGNEYDEGIVDLSGKKEPGKYYVAISRFKNPKRVQIKNYNPTHVMVYRGVTIEMERLRQNPLTLDPPALSNIFQHHTLQHFYVQNINGYPSKEKYIRAMPNANNIYLFCFVETHHSQGFTPEIISSMNMFHLDIASKRGGIILLCKKEMSLIYRYQTAENNAPIHCIVFSIDEIPNMNFIACYFHPTYKGRDIAHIVRMGLDQCTAPNIVAMGDFNVQANDATPSADYRQLIDTFNARKLIQHVKSPTNMSGNTIDHVWAQKDVPKGIMTHETFFSDHFPILFHLKDIPP